jgi:ABC-type transport system involved in multi-copper enzyme maturation permease subunit
MPFGARSFPERFDALSNELSVIQIVFGFALGSTLLVREIDDGTLNFLDGLPLERSAIFMAKIKAAMLVLTSLPLGTLLLTVALHLATRGSLDHALQPFLLLTFFGLSILVTAVGLTAGMLLGFLRYLSWLGSPAPSMTTSSIRWARSFSTAS